MIWMPEGQRRPTTSQMTVISIDLSSLVINFLVKGGFGFHYTIVGLNEVSFNNLVSVCEC